MFSPTIYDVTQAVAKRLMRGVARRLGQPKISHDVESSIIALINCMLLAIRNGRPRGITAWAMRAVEEFGYASALKMGTSVVEAIAEEAALDAHNFGTDRDGVNGALQACLACITQTAGPLGPTMFPGGFADSDAGFALLDAARTRKPNCRRDLVAVGLWVRRLCARMQLSTDFAATVEACAGFRAVSEAGVPVTAIYANPKLQRYAAAVRAQYERWDGTGYPDRLKGDQIPLEARIAAVADGISEMMRATPDPGEAASARHIIESLKRGSGGEWDPEVIRVLFDILGVPAEDEARNVS